MGMCSSSQSVSKHSKAQYTDIISVSKCKGSDKKELLNNRQEPRISTINEGRDESIQNKRSGVFLHCSINIDKDIPLTCNNMVSEAQSRLPTQKETENARKNLKFGSYVSPHLHSSQTKRKSLERAPLPNENLKKDSINSLLNLKPLEDDMMYDENNMIESINLIVKMESISNGSGYGECKKQRTLSQLTQRIILSSDLVFDKYASFIYVESSGVTKNVPLLSNSLAESSILSRRRRNKNKVPNDEYERKTLPVFSVKSTIFLH